MELKSAFGTDLRPWLLNRNLLYLVCVSHRFSYYLGKFLFSLFHIKKIMKILIFVYQIK